jgi:hypothetical protein
MEIGDFRRTPRQLLTPRRVVTPRRFLTPRPQQSLSYLIPQPPSNSPMPIISSWSRRPTPGFEMQLEDQGQSRQRRPMQTIVPGEGLPELIRGRENVPWSQRQSIVPNSYATDLSAFGGPVNPAIGTQSKQTADNRRQRNMVSGTRYPPRHLPHAMVAPQQQNIHLHIPHITAVAGHGSIRLDCRSVNPQRPAGSMGRDRRRRKTRLFSLRRNRRSLLSEDWPEKGLATAVQTGMTTADLKKNIDSYEVSKPNVKFIHIIVDRHTGTDRYAVNCRARL